MRSVTARFSLLPRDERLFLRMVVLAMVAHAAFLMVVNMLPKSSVKEVNVPDMPQSLEAAIGPEYSEKQRQLHSIGPQVGPSSVSHGAGDRAADQKDKDLRFCQAVDRALMRLLAPSDARLYLASTEPLASIFLHATHYANAQSEWVHGSPARVSNEELAAGARKIIVAPAARRPPTSRRPPSWSEARCAAT